ncbi:MAG: protein translocase subunit SecD, partial [Pseudomonadota bacterium]
MNRYPGWVNVAVLATLLLGVFLALPNIFGEVPALQISRDDNQPVAEQVRLDAVEALSDAGIEVTAAYEEDGRQYLRFAKDDDDNGVQLRARELLINPESPVLNPRQYVVALTRAPLTPEWMRNLGMRPVSLGLDLRGGVHFLYEVDLETGLTQSLDQALESFTSILREENIRWRNPRRTGDRIIIPLQSAAKADQAIDAIRGDTQDFDLTTTEIDGTTAVVARFTENQIRERRSLAIQQNTSTLRDRVNQLGVAEPLVQQQGIDRIVVQLPGVQDPRAAREVLGATATLEFRLADVNGDPGAASRTGRAPIGTALYSDRNGQPVLLKRDIIVRGEQLTNATAGFSEGQPAVFIDLNAEGAKRMLDVTKDNVGNPMAVVFIEDKQETVMVNGEETRRRYREETVINVATIRDTLSNRFQITGLTSLEAKELALKLRAGSLAAPLYIV